jgi:ferric-dicitrate binding protein FerR (iron transport regulator)
VNHRAEDPTPADDPSFRQEEAIEVAAMDWLLGRDEGFAPGRRAAFARWRDADSRHAAALDRLERTWALLEGLAASVRRSGGRRSPLPQCWRWSLAGHGAPFSRRPTRPRRAPSKGWTSRTDLR